MAQSSISAALSLFKGKTGFQQPSLTDLKSLSQTHSTHAHTHHTHTLHTHTPQIHTHSHTHAHTHTHTLAHTVTHSHTYSSKHAICDFCISLKCSLRHILIRLAGLRKCSIGL